MNDQARSPEQADAKDSTGTWVLIATVLASSMVFIEYSALNVALPALQEALNATGPQLLWMINSYALILAALILVGGALGDKLGRKLVFIVGIVIFTIAAAACGLAQSAQFLIWARALQGAGGALTVPGSLAILSAYFSSERRGQAIGTWSAAATISALGGPVLGGVLAQAGLWRLIFFINVPLAIATIAILILKVPESRDPDAPPRIDLIGALLATIGLAGLAYGFTAASERGFSDPVVIGALVGGMVAFAAFVLVESRIDHPMISLHLFQSRTFSGINLMTLLLYGALAAFSFFFSLNLIQAQGYPESIAGLASLPFGILLGLMSRWAGTLVDKVGPRLPLIIGPSLVGAGFLWLSFTGQTAGPADYWLAYFPGVLLSGVGMGVTVAPLTTAVMGSVSSRHAGTASGVNNAVSRTAGVLAIAILGSVAIFAFTRGLEGAAAALDLPAEAAADLAAEARQLGDAQAPESIPAGQAEAVQAAIEQEFIGVFQLVMWVCAALAFLSAGVSALLVEDKLVELQDEPARAV